MALMERLDLSDKRQLGPLAGEWLQDSVWGDHVASIGAVSRMRVPVDRKRTISGAEGSHPPELCNGESWLGLSEQFFRVGRWRVCRVQAAAICGSLVK